MPRLLKDRIFKEIGEFYNRHFQETYSICRDVVLNPEATYKRYKEEFSNSDSNAGYKENRLQFIDQTLSKAVLCKVITENFSPKPLDSKNCTQYSQSKASLEMVINKITTFMVNVGKDTSLQPMIQKINQQTQSSQTVSQETTQKPNKNENNPDLRGHVTFTIPNNNHKVL